MFISDGCFGLLVIPVLLQLNLYDTYRRVYQDSHVIVIDGYGYMNKGGKKLYHMNLGWGGLNLKGDSAYNKWYDISLMEMIFNEKYTGILGPNSTIFNISFVYNIMSDDLNGTGKEIVTGRLWSSGKEYNDAVVKTEYIRRIMGTEYSMPLSTTTNDKGIFVFRTPSNATLGDITVEGTTILKGKLNSKLKILFKDYDMIGESISSTEPEEEIDPSPTLSSYSTEGTDILSEPISIGNKNYGDIVLDTAALTGLENGLLNGVNEEYDIPLPYASGSFAGNNWDFSEIKALYMDDLPYDIFVAQPWYNSLSIKIRDAVMAGATAYLTGGAFTIAHYLSTQASEDERIQFHAYSPYPIYQQTGYSRTILKGSLQEDVGLDEIVIPYYPYVTGGPLISNVGNAASVLASVELVMNIDGTLYNVKYPIACTFKLGKGKVFYSSFAIPEDIGGIIVDPPEGTMPAMQAPTGQTTMRSFANWFMSKPIANAELVRLAEAYDIDNASSGERENTTLDKGKTIGLPINLSKTSEDVTVIAMISDMVMGKINYGDLPIDYDKHRRWTASLSNSTGQHYETRTTSDDKMVFHVKAEDNDGGTWRIRIDSATGYLDKNLFATMVVEDKREDIEDGGHQVDPGFISVAGVNVSPSSGEIEEIGSTLQLTASIIPPNATSQDVTWATTSPDIVLVDANGLVTAIAFGIAKVTVTTEDGGYIAESIITVRSASTVIHVTGVTLSPTTDNISVGSSLQLTGSIIPPNATNKDVTWNTSNTAVATVSSTGLVKGVNTGSAIITVTAMDGGFAASCDVTVTPDPNNKATINGTMIGLAGNANGAGWSWNADANTLTLISGNANLGDIAFVTDNNITISITGNTAAKSIANTGSGKLTITGVSGSSLTLSSDTGPAICANNDIEINSGVIYAYTTAENASAIESMNGSVIISGAAIVTAETVNGNGAAICASVNINISTNENVKAIVDEGFSLEASAINITNGITELFFDVYSGNGAYNVNDPSFSGSSTKVYANGLQVYPHVSATLKVSFQGRASGSYNNIEKLKIVWISNGMVVAEEAVTSDHNGEAQAGIPMLNMDLTIWVKGERTLAVSQYVGTIANGSVINVGTLPGGDSNGDNMVDINDFNILLNNYGRNSDSPGFNRFADFNNDGLADLNDFNIFLNSYGMKGAQIPLVYLQSAMSMKPHNKESKKLSVDETDSNSSNSGCNAGMIGFALIILSLLPLLRSIFKTDINGAKEK